MEIVRIFNPSDAPISAMFNGTSYLLPARGYAHVPRVAAEHFVAYYRARGVTIAPDDAPAAPEHEEDGALDGSADDTSDATAEEIADASAAVCEICQKDFRDRERPAVALARHKRLAHPA
jgi:hypothetical protein